MKKFTKFVVVLTVAAIALGSASIVFAQGTTPDSSLGRGRRGGHGSGEGMLYQNPDRPEEGLLHDLMIEAFAKALNIDPEVLESRLADGERLSEIADLSIDEFREMMLEVRTQVFEQAVEDGLLPESQSKWFNFHHSGMGKFGGMRGQRQGFYGTGDCMIE